MKTETATSVTEKVMHRLGRAMGTFSMLRRGDRVAVGVSGGKDSLCLLHALAAYRPRAPFPFEVVALTVDQGKFTSPIQQIEASIRRADVEWVLRKDPRTLELVAQGVEHGCRQENEGGEQPQGDRSSTRSCHAVVVTPPRPIVGPSHRSPRVLPYTVTRRIDPGCRLTAPILLLPRQ